MKNLKTTALLAAMFGACCIIQGNTGAAPQNSEMWNLGGAAVLMWSLVIYSSLPKYKKS